MIAWYTGHWSLRFCKFALLHTLPTKHPWTTLCFVLEACRPASSGHTLEFGFHSIAFGGLHNKLATCHLDPSGTGVATFAFHPRSCCRVRQAHHGNVERRFDMFFLFVAHVTSVRGSVLVQSGRPIIEDSSRWPRHSLCHSPFAIRTHATIAALWFLHFSFRSSWEEGRYGHRRRHDVKQPRHHHYRLLHGVFPILLHYSKVDTLAVALTHAVG